MRNKRWIIFRDFSREGEARNCYPFGLVNVAKAFKLVPRGFLVRKLSKIMEFERCVITAQQQVSHPVEGDLAEKRRSRMHVGVLGVIGLFNGIPPAFLHLTTKHHRWEYICNEKMDWSTGRCNVYAFVILLGKDGSKMLLRSTLSSRGSHKHETGCARF